MGAYSGVEAYLSSSGSEVGAYSGGGLIREWGHNRSFTVFQTNLNKAVNIFCTLPEWIRNTQMIQCFTTIKTRMRTLHG